MEKIIALASQIKTMMDEDPRFKKLEILDKKLSNDNEAMKLTYIKDMKELNYSDTLKHYSSDSNEVRKAQKELFEAKKELDSLEIVKEYNHAYSEVRKIYDEINKILFNDLVSNVCSGKNK